MTFTRCRKRIYGPILQQDNTLVARPACYCQFLRGEKCPTMRQIGFPLSIVTDLTFHSPLTRSNWNLVWLTLIRLIRHSRLMPSRLGKYSNKRNSQISPIHRNFFSVSFAVLSHELKFPIDFEFDAFDRQNSDDSLAGICNNRRYWLTIINFINSTQALAHFMAIWVIEVYFLTVSWLLLSRPAMAKGHATERGKPKRPPLPRWGTKVERWNRSQLPESFKRWKGVL